MRARKILLFIAIILILIIIGLAIIYYKTDFFKSDRQKFWKYISTNSKVTTLYNDKDIQGVKNRRSNSPYEVNSNLVINKDDKTYRVTIDTTAKNSNDIITFVNFQYNDRSIADFKLIKESNLIALKMDELANGYIAIKNNEIKKLASEAGIEDTTNIPDSINWFSLLELLYVSENDEKYFTSMYSDLISKNTDRTSYSKEESGIKIGDKIHTTTGYKIKLNESEAKEILKVILKHMSEEDSRALNFISSKAKLLNLPSKYTDINTLSDRIKKIIQYLDSLETNNDNFIEITVYVEDGNVIQTNINIKDSSNIKFIYDADNRKITIKQEEVNEVLKNLDNKIARYLSNLQEVNISTQVSEDKNAVITKFDAKFYNDLMIEYNSRTAIVDSIEENTDFINSIKVVLNELEVDKLKKLYGLLKNNALTIYNEKLEIIKNNSEEYETEA